MAMKTISSREFQKNIGANIDLVTTGESLRITRYGRTKCFIIPESSDTEEILRRMAGKRLSKMLKKAKPNEATQSLTQDDINKMIYDCFA
jgi:antitoxin (DNA-binding transcriptional repressor) of toxin-antitoxin stability system